MTKKLLFLGIFGAWAYFVALSIFGQTHIGNDQNDYIYNIYWLMIFVFSIATYINGLFRLKLYRRSIHYLWIPISVLMLLVISFGMFGLNPNGNVKYFEYFVVQCISTFILGMQCALQKGEKKLFGSIELIIIISIPAIMNSFSKLLSGGSEYSVLDDLGGMGRMGIAYSMSQIFVYTFLMLNLTSKKNQQLIEGIFAKRQFNIIRLLILVMSGFTILSSGTRGALIVIIVIPFIYLAILFIKNKKTFLKRLFIFVILGSLAVLFVKFSFNMDYIDFSLKRFGLFFDASSRDNGNWAGGSGREILYPLALSLFQKSPILGLGPFGFFTKVGMYPHDIFLELLVDYGIVGLSIGIIFLTIIIVKYIRLSKENSTVLVMFMMFLAELIRNLFSGTFFSSYILWFFIGYVLTIKRTSINTNLNATAFMDDKVNQVS